MDSGSERSLRGKTILVTGGTDGIGKQTALELAQSGANVWIVGRNRVKCKAVSLEIGARLSDSRTIQPLVADLSSIEGVKSLAAEVRNRLGRLDVLLNNAGGMFMQRELTVDGLERTFALNHLAYFTLTHELMPLLRASAPARIICVASDAHRAAQGIQFEDLQSERRYSGWKAYCQSKLANVLFVRELARRIEGSGVSANALHPGFVRTAFFSWPGMAGTMTRLFARIAAISVEAGARTPVYLARSEEVSGVSGKYFYKCKYVEPSTWARDDAAARRLWDVSASLTGLAQGVEGATA